MEAEWQQHQESMGQQGGEGSGRGRWVCPVPRHTCRCPCANLVAGQSHQGGGRVARICLLVNRHAWVASARSTLSVVRWMNGMEWRRNHGMSNGIRIASMCPLPAVRGARHRPCPQTWCVVVVWVVVWQVVVGSGVVV